MSKEQIEIMANDINETLKHNAVIDIINGGYIGLNTDGIARELYDDGYRKQSEWISVDERLPHSQQMVIGYTPCDGYMFVGFYQKVDSPYWKSYWSVITAMRSTKKITKKVTHWMPLPEPPKMKGGAE